MNPQGPMTYERYDVGSTQPGVRHTAPNVDRVMGLAASQETTVDRLLTVVERLTAELATTQSALHDLALEVARAGIGSGGGAGQAPTVGYGTGVSTLSSGTVPLAPDHTSHLPPRRSDHAVISELATYSPERHRAPATDGVGRAAPQTGATYAPNDALAGVVPADPVDAAPGATPVEGGSGFQSTDPTDGDGPHTEVATTLAPEQRAAADASATAAASVAAAAASAQTAGTSGRAASEAATDGAATRDPSQPGPAATYGGPTAPPAPAFDPAPAAGTGTPRTDLVASLNDVQLLSAGAVDVMVGPVRDLADLDHLENRILQLPSIEAVTVMAFEGRDVLVKIEIERPLPLASMLRTELGRPVESCRLVEGRIVVTFAEPEPTR